MKYGEDDSKDKKSGFAIAIGLPKGMGKKKPADEGEPDADDADQEGRTAAGEDLAAAIKSGDGAAIADAFASLRDLA
jgi:hypothetical protein